MPETFVLFQVGGATYAVRSEHVQQVEMPEAITRVPNAPDYVEGVTSVRGQVLPVINLRRRFRLEAAPATLRTRLIVIRMDGRTVAMLADTAREFISLARDQIKPPPEDLSGPGVEYLDGIVVLDQRLILVVNLHRLLSASERHTLTEDLPASGSNSDQGS